MVNLSKRNRILVLSESCILLVIAAVVISTPAATGYEISVYKGFPAYFIPLLFSSYLIGFTLMITDSFSKGGLSVMGLCILLITTLVFLSLPVVRNYHLFLTSDAMFHLGQIKNIIDTGYFPDDLIYPALHMLVAIIAKTVGQSSGQILYLISFVFVGTSVCFAYLFAQNLIPDSTASFIILGFLLMILLPGSVNTSPFAMSYKFIIVVLYLVLKSGQNPRRAYKVLTIIFLLSLVIFHILTLIYSVVAIGLFFICARGYPSISSKSPTRLGPQNTRYLFISSIIAAYLWLAEEIGYKLGRTIVTLFPYASGPSGGRLDTNEGDSVTEFSPLLPDFLEGTRVGTYLSVLIENTPGLSEIARVFVFRYGIIVLIAIGVGIVIMYNFRYKSNRLLYFEELLTVYTASLLSWVTGIFINEWSAVLRRMVVLGSISGVVIISTGVKDMYDDRDKYKKVLSVILVILMFSVFAISALSVYNSPIDSSPNSQRTDMDMTGGAWLFNYSVNEVELKEVGFSVRRYSQFRTNQSTTYGSPPADHFGYDSRQYYASNRNDPVYLIVTRKGITTYPKLYPNNQDGWRYRPRDFTRLDQDQTIQQIYANGEFNAYYAGE